MKQEVNNAEEVETLVNSLVAEKRWAINVIKLPTGTFVINWTEHKKYTARNGKEFFDEIWINDDGEIKLVQDLEPEHARNILRQMLRREREGEEFMNRLLSQVVDDDDDDDDFSSIDKPNTQLH